MTSHSINTVGPDVGVCEQRWVGPGEEECVRPDGVRWFLERPRDGQLPRCPPGYGRRHSLSTIAGCPALAPGSSTSPLSPEARGTFCALVSSHVRWRGTVTDDVVSKITWVHTSGIYRGPRSQKLRSGVGGSGSPSSPTGSFLSRSTQP